MKQKFNIFNIKITPEFNNQLKKICDSTKETKSDVIRRLVQNEYARIENNPDEVIELKQTQVEDMKASIMASLKLTDSVRAETQKVLASNYILHKNLLRILFIIVDILFTKLGMPGEEIDKLNESTYRKAGKSLNEINNIINKGLTATIKQALSQEIKKN